MIDPEVTGYAKVKGGSIWYRINGIEFLEGNNLPIIVIHGGPGSDHTRLLTLLALKNRRAIIFYDQLDCGKSDSPNKKNNWTVERYTSEIPGLLKHLNIKDYILLGHSAGATWAILHAVDDQVGLKGLILSSPLISTPIWLKDNQKLIKTLPTDTRITIEKCIEKSEFENKDYIKAVEVYDALFYCRKPKLLVGMPKLNNNLYNFMWGPSEFFSNGTLKELDLTNKLKHIPAPTLFICGEWDSARPDSCEYFSSKVNDSEVSVIKDAAHCSYLEQTDIYNSIIEDFFEKNKI